MKHTLRLLALCLALLAASLAPAPLVQASPADLVEEADTPKDYVLSAAYPNPFNPRTSFSLTVTERQDVKVQIFNLLGQPVKQLFEGTLEAGQSQTFTFEAGELPSGIYLYRVTGENFTATRQVTLLK